MKENPAGPAPESEQRSSQELRTGDVRRLLIAYSAPALVSITAASIYNIIDRIFLGHAVGPLALAALALALPIMNLATAVGALVGVGGSALVSIRLGERRVAEAESILGNVLLLNLIFGLGFTVLGLLWLDPILRLIGASSGTLPYARQFLQIILAANVFTHLYLGQNNVMRAAGNPRGAMLNTLLTVALNCVLAPLFLFVFHGGMRGAALATALAQVAGALCAFPRFLSARSVVRFRLAALRLDARVVRDIFRIGMASFLMMLCASLTAFLYNAQFTRIGGDYAVGAFGVVYTLAIFFIMLSLGVNLGMQPIAGFNYGAGQFDRVRAVFRYAVMGSTSASTLGFLLAELWPRPVAALFTRDARLIEETVTGLRILMLTFPLLGFQETTVTLFQSIGRARVSLWLSLSRQILYLIPALLLLPRFFGLRGLWCASPCADLAAFLTAVLVLRGQRLGPAEELRA